MSQHAAVNTVDPSTTRAAAAGREGAAPANTQVPAPRRPGRRRRGSEIRKRIEIAFFVTPALALIALFVVWPVITAVQMSMYQWNGRGPMTNFVGFENYLTVLSDDVFRGAFTNTMIIAVASIALQLPLGLAIALLLNRNMRGRDVLRTIVFVPYVIAEVVAGVIWFQLLQPQYGVIDTFLSAVGLPTPEQGWLGDPQLALWTVIGILTWKYLGLAIILFLAGLQSVPAELYEAAQLDGASWWQVQRKVTLPLLGPTIRTWGFLSMIGSLQLFDMVWILTKGGPADSTTTMAVYLVNEGTKSANFGIAGAASVVLFFIALVMAVLYQRFILSRDSKEA